MYFHLCWRECDSRIQQFFNNLQSGPQFVRHRYQASLTSVCSYPLTQLFQWKFQLQRSESAPSLPESPFWRAKTEKTRCIVTTHDDSIAFKALKAAPNAWLAWSAGRRSATRCRRPCFHPPRPPRRCSVGWSVARGEGCSTETVPPKPRIPWDVGRGTWDKHVGKHFGSAEHAFRWRRSDEHGEVQKSDPTAVSFRD